MKYIFYIILSLLFLSINNSYSQGKYIEPIDFHPDMIMDSSNVVLIYFGTVTLETAHDMYYELVEKYRGRSMIIVGILNIFETKCGYQKGIYFYIKCDCVCRKHPFNKLEIIK